MSKIASGSGFLANPRSPAQVRAVLAGLRNKDEDLSGEVDQLQGQADPINATFDSLLSEGQPVRVSSNGNVDAADASDISTADVIGLVFAGAGAGSIGEYVPEGGRISQSDWSSVIGSTNLTAGARYFLDTTAGRLTETAPTTTSQVVIKVGRALTTTLFVVELGDSILL